MDQNQKLRLLQWFNKTGVVLNKDNWLIETFFTNDSNMNELRSILIELGLEPIIKERIIYDFRVHGIDILFKMFTDEELSPYRRHQKEVYKRLKNAKTFTLE